MKRIALSAAAVALVVAADAAAFTHVVQRGETLASIAEKYYGRIQNERVLVAANALDAQGGVAIVPGMRLEVPAVGHRRVERGETWASLAGDMLGSEHRADVLAIANGTSPWLAPSDGQEILVPYNLRVIATNADTIVNIAYRFMGDVNKAWILDHYNTRGGRKVIPGDVLLVPVTDLELTEEGKARAKRSAEARASEAGGDDRQTQKQVENELPLLITDVREGRYVDAVRRGSRFLVHSGLTEPQLARTHRLLLEAYVALDAKGLAAESCSEWRKRDPGARLDVVMMSPKILSVCQA